LAKIRIFSYLPNPRVWKSLIAAKIGGVEVEVVGDKPNQLTDWLWDFDAKFLSEQEKLELDTFKRDSKRGFSGAIYKTDNFMREHPFGTVPAGFIGNEKIGVFESNSILRAVARQSQDDTLYGGKDHELQSRIDSFLDVNLVFSREFQVYLLEMDSLTSYTYDRTKAAYEFYLDGIEKALSVSDFIVGDNLTIADISYVCEISQFLREARYEKQLLEINQKPISSEFQTKYPLSFSLMKTLSKKKEFNEIMGSYLDWYKM
jgi:elongation factor 1-gamma